jgi:predicted enzyme related to lactoylglutathione lyase
VPDPLSLTSLWYPAPGSETQALAALRQLAADVYADEPDTLMYFIHTPFPDEDDIVSLPPVAANTVLFLETYRTPQAFLAHVNGSIFKNFVAEHGSLFVNSNGKPFSMVTFLTRFAGFIRPEASAKCHPSVMFEVIANDQANLQDFYSKLFDWRYDIGSGGFAYVRFPNTMPPLLGGIGQAQPHTPGFEPGHSFDVLVDDLNVAIQRAVANGGKRYMDPATVDGYHFAMIKDPEDNPIGLLLPFSS